MTRDDVAGRIEAFVRRQFAVAPTDTTFRRSVHLFDRGYVDSIGVVELLAFLAEEFGVDVPDEDLQAENFTTIDGIAGTVSRLRASAAKLA